MQEPDRLRNSPMASPIRSETSFHTAHSPAVNELRVLESPSASALSSSTPPAGERHRKSGKSHKHLVSKEKENEGDPIEFVYAVPEVLICPMHKDLLANPVIARCGHTFCRACIERHLAEHPQCPLDSMPLQALPEYLFPNLAVSNQISNLVIFCKYGLKRRKKKGWDVLEGGCIEQIKLGERHKHEDTCGFAIIRCPYCDSSPMRRNQLEEHSKGCSRLPCDHSEAGCTFVGRKEDLPAHLKGCVYEPIKEYIARTKTQMRAFEESLKKKENDSEQLEATVRTLEEKSMGYDINIKQLTHMLEETQRQLNNALSEVSQIRKNMASGIGGVPIEKKEAAPGQPALEVLPGMAATQFKCIGTFSGHTGPVWCLAVNPDLQVLISGSSDSTVKVWDIATFKVKRTFVGHEGIVHAVAHHGRTFISGSSDKTIKVWSMDKPKAAECLKTLLGHDNTISSLLVGAGYLCSGSYSHIKVWDLENFECQKTLTGHNHWVRAMSISGFLLYSASYNVIKVFDVRSWECVRTVTAHHGSIYSMVCSPKYLLCGTYENSVCVYNLESLESVQNLSGHTAAVYAISLLGTKFAFSGSYDSTIRVWDLDTLRCTQTLVRHTTTVDALASYNGCVFSGSADHSIKVWK